MSSKSSRKPQKRKKPTKKSSKKSRRGRKASGSKSEVTKSSTSSSNQQTKQTKQKKQQAPAKPAEDKLPAQPSTPVQVAETADKHTVSSDTQSSAVKAYISLMRLDRPIGILLLLWPTYWSLWLAARGIPSIKNLVIFTLGCIVMRSAGCVINDFADRHVDAHVQRTQNRPLATGTISVTEALILFGVLCTIAFTLVLLTNPLTIKLSFGAITLAIIYPFMKRFTHMPQVFLGAAFAWSIPMAFAAELGEVNASIWLLYVAVVIWAVVYDTFYAMIDREDDIKIGVKSTAILFGEADRFITGALQGLVLIALILAGRRFELSWAYFTCLLVVAGLFVYQQQLIKDRNRDLCFKAFLNNNYVGLIVFIGVWAGLYFA